MLITLFFFLLIWREKSSLIELKKVFRLIFFFFFCCLLHFSVSVSTPWAWACYIRLLLVFFHLRQNWRNLGSFCTLCFFKPAVPPDVFVEVGQKADQIKHCIPCRCSCAHFDSSQWAQVRLITLTTAPFCPSNPWQWVSESVSQRTRHPGPETEDAKLNSAVVIFYYRAFFCSFFLTKDVFMLPW